MAYQSQDIIRRSATNGLTPAPQAQDFQEEVAKFIDVTTCIGCRACQMAYSEWNDICDTVGNNIGAHDSPSNLSAEPWAVMRFSEMEQNDKLEWLICRDGCMHCSDPDCLKACPAEGAIIQYTDGIANFQSEQRIGRDYYTVDCPLDIPHLNPKDNRVYKCTLCVGYVVAGQEPACVKTCPTGMIHFDTKGSIKTLAGERVVELKTHSYNNTGLYGSVGVGGTHAMCVLHHADKLDLYHGLPKSPEISETMKFWRSIWKPLAIADFAAIFAISVFHYISVGPSHVDKEENNLHEEKDKEHK